jgi:hypothetical protein
MHAARMPVDNWHAGTLEECRRKSGIVMKNNADQP